ncbi:MAG: hypothetical protein HKO62_03390 [Gammaproteobacteria bacterium]|nr:hypothetical protein [Gammaproteobacteria bacterium]NNL99769.1 hypothetical protein [Gammaproteobacteria bacterium]
MQVLAIVANAVPFTFANGLVADAEQVNQNFESLETRIDMVSGSFARYQQYGSFNDGPDAAPTPASVLQDLGYYVDGCRMVINWKPGGLGSASPVVLCGQYVDTLTIDGRRHASSGRPAVTNEGPLDPNHEQRRTACRQSS